MNTWVVAGVKLTVAQRDKFIQQSCGAAALLMVLLNLVLSEVTLRPLIASGLSDSFRI